MPTDNRARIAATCIPALAVVSLLVCFALFAPTLASANGNGSGGAVFKQPPLTAPKGVFVGKKTRIKGHVTTGPGRYAISAKLGRADWLPVTNVTADADGDFAFRWKAPKSGRFRFRVTPTAAAAAASAPTTASLHVYRKQKTTWYGPGFYGKRTACGKRLTRRTIGVAHRKLRCGTKVEFFYRGRKVVVPVIDRGPFVRGVVWDLTRAAMKRLGSSRTIVPGVVTLR